MATDNKNPFALAVVGGGHAGAEAALAAARMGVNTILVTAKRTAIAQMPCNPSIGGLAKSHLVYELDALGGEMGKNADATALQAKTLNRSRGPAVWATRCQCAKREYAARMQSILSQQTNLTVLEDIVVDVQCKQCDNADRMRHCDGLPWLYWCQGCCSHGGNITSWTHMDWKKCRRERRRWTPSGKSLVAESRKSRIPTDQA